MILVPEIIIFEAIRIILETVRDDWENQTDKTKTLLYRDLNGLVYGKRYNLYEQAKAIILPNPENGDSRVLDVRMFFDSQRAKLPTIHINLPADNTAPDSMGIGEAEADVQAGETDDSIRPVFRRKFSAVYNIVITSENSLEVLTIYHFMKARLIALFNHLQSKGLENPSISGHDLTLNSDLVPTHIFARALPISFSYYVEAVKYDSIPKINEIITTANPSSGLSC